MSKSMTVVKHEKKEDDNAVTIDRNNYNSMKELLFSSILRSGRTGLTRGEITISMNIPWSTAYDWLTKLEQEGKITRFYQKIGKGRPRTKWIVSS